MTSATLLYRKLESTLYPQNTPRYLPRRVDHLGVLGSKLRDLRGFATLVHELLQNADDADGATLASIQITPRAMVVDNDGVFSDCGRVDLEDAECVWLEDPTKRHRCDFHSFQLVASANKRQREGTTGAFGVGFTAVYQVTDRPELLSAGRHWILQEEKSESERIRVCDGCDHCNDSELPGTRFILPWASEAKSELRRQLQAAAVTDQTINDLITEIESAIPTTAIFLKKINSIDLYVHDSPPKCFERIVDGDDVLIQHGDEYEHWHLVIGNFHSTADGLRQQYGDNIEAKRSTEVVLAIPVGFEVPGLLCATLPTQFRTGLPFHVNGDFFTSSDRKSVILEADYQGEWNCAILSGAGKALRDHFDALRQILGPERLWGMISSIYEVAEEAKGGQREAILASFWSNLIEGIRSSPVVYTANKEWRTPSDVLLLESSDEEAAISILTQLQIQIVHPSLRPYMTLLRGGDSFAISLLDLHHISERLSSLGLTVRMQSDAAPAFIRQRDQLITLWNEIDLLLQRRRSSERQRSLELQLANCAIAPGLDGYIWPCKDAFIADDDTVSLFSELSSDHTFVDTSGMPQIATERLCQSFSVRSAIKLLDSVDERELVRLYETKTLDPARMLQWFEARIGELRGQQDVLKALTNIAIFPTAEGLRPLSQLALPGGFEDHLGLTNVVDLRQLGGRREFLVELGASQLDFEHYITEHVNRAFRSQTPVSRQDKRKLVQLLAGKLGEIRDSRHVQDVLSRLPIVECSDGRFRPGSVVYFEYISITNVLGEKIHLAVVPTERTEAVRELYRYLGVSEQPRIYDVVTRVRALTSAPPSRESIEAIEQILLNLGEQFVHEADLGAFSPLKTMAWLPAKFDPHQWYKPSDIFAGFSSHLFESQATFLRISIPTQQKTSELLEFLGVESRPTVQQVVRHLLYCAVKGTPVSNSVYQHLNYNVQDEALEQLKGQKCLLLDNSEYVRPDHTFWEEHPFGQYRYQLADHMNHYRELLSRMGVRVRPDHSDALQVLVEIAEQYEMTQRPVEDLDYHIILECWRILSRALDDGTITDADLIALKDRRTIPNHHRHLRKPTEVYFENRVGLAAKFGGFLDNHVVSRIEGTWRAMRDAGLRPLSHVVTPVLADAQDVCEDVSLVSRIRERGLLLARLIPDGLSKTRQLETVLRDLSCPSVGELKVRYQLDAVYPPRLSDVETVRAQFIRTEQSLYFVPVNAARPWADISRELATAISPDNEPGQLALGVNAVLSASTLQEASATLDDLGFAPLQEAAEPGVSLEPERFGLGGDSEPEVFEEPIDDVTIEDNMGDADTDHKSPNEDVKGVSSRAVPSPTRPDSETHGSNDPHPDVETEPDQSGRLNPGEKPESKEPAKRRDRGRLVTYASAETSEDPDVSEDRVVSTPGGDRRLGDLGEDRVVEYERQQGRNARKMSRNHPGYDVESKNAEGETVRIIEVKSVSDVWDSLGAGMSRTQFEKARELGDLYWLYVVERPQSDDFTIYRIQNPAVSVTHFQYDYGWRDLAEPDNEQDGANNTA